MKSLARHALERSQSMEGANEEETALAKKSPRRSTVAALARRGTLTAWGSLRYALVAALALGICLACGTSVAPQELKDARDAYAQAKQGIAAKLAPAHLETAKQALDEAEQSFRDDGDDQVT